MIILSIVGVVMILAGGASTRKKIEDKFGEVTPMTKKMSEGTGIVPTSTSMLVLIGYVLVAVGIIGQIAS
jgi:SNF family Na+-dependent transporter